MSIHAWSILTRQSTPMTSPPAACNSRKNPDAPVPKWITGTLPVRMRSINARIRRDKTHVIIGTQSAHPAIEHLNSAGAGGNLAQSERPEYIDQLSHQTAPQRFVLVHHGFCPDEVFRRAAFDHVA